MIVITVGGQRFCEDCYADLGYIEDQFSLHVNKRVPEGVCGCCGVEVVTGEPVLAGE